MNQSEVSGQAVNQDGNSGRSCLIVVLTVIVGPSLVALLAVCAGWPTVWYQTKAAKDLTESQQAHDDRIHSQDRADKLADDAAQAERNRPKIEPVDCRWVGSQVSFVVHNTSSIELPIASAKVRWGLKGAGSKQPVSEAPATAAQYPIDLSSAQFDVEASISPPLVVPAGKVVELLITLPAHGQPLYELEFRYAVDRTVEAAVPSSAVSASLSQDELFGLPAAPAEDVAAPAPGTPDDPFGAVLP